MQARRCPFLSQNASNAPSPELPRLNYCTRRASGHSIAALACPSFDQANVDTTQALQELNRRLVHSPFLSRFLHPHLSSSSPYHKHG